jgi:hypothetical protein
LHERRERVFSERVNETALGPNAESQEHAFEVELVICSGIKILEHSHEHERLRLFILTRARLDHRQYDAFF